MIITLTIVAVTYYSGRRLRKKAMGNLSEAGKQKEAQAAKPKFFLGKEAYNQKGLKYRKLVWAIIILGLILAVLTIHITLWSY